LVNISLKRAYFFRNPYRMLRRFLQKRGDKEVFLYGETPLTTIQKIVEEFKIPRGASFCDFGSGRGHIPLFLASTYGMRAVGIEEVPSFVKIANRIAAKYALSARFFCQDFTTWEEEPDFVYLYGTCLSDAVIEKLVKTPWKRTQWITVSFPFSDYSSRFRVEKKLLGQYPWGEADVFLNRIEP
jgi:hypothetical protein